MATKSFPHSELILTSADRMEDRATSLHGKLKSHIKRRGGIASYQLQQQQQLQYTRKASIQEHNKGSIPNANSATTTETSTTTRHRRRLAICSGSSSGRGALKENVLTFRKFVDRSSLVRLRIHLEPTRMDIVFDQNGKTVGNHEGNLQFHRLCSSYVNDHKSKTTRLHRSLVYIEMLDELKALGVQFYTIRASSSLCALSSSSSLLPLPGSNEKSEIEEYPVFCSCCKHCHSVTYSSMGDSSALQRIQDAFLARLRSIR